MFDLDLALKLLTIVTIIIIELTLYLFANKFELMYYLVIDTCVRVFVRRFMWI